MTREELNPAMNRALTLAQLAADNGDVPVGAVVVDESGAIVGEGYNLRNAQTDPLAHAELVALWAAAEAIGSWNLEKYTLVVTLEPCPMCAGAAVMAHVGHIVFGAWDEKMGACGSVWDIPRDPHIGFSPEVIGGLEEKQAKLLLREFFAARR